MTAQSYADFLDGRVTLHGGDCLDILKTLPDASVDSVVTDPPYHLTSIVKRFGGANAAPAKAKQTGAYARSSKGFMGKTWDGGDIAFRSELWAEVLRVLKPGGHMAAFSGTRTYHRMAVAIEDAGFEIRDQLAWTYGSGFPKSHDVSKAIDKRRNDSADIIRVTMFLAAAADRAGKSRSDIDEHMGTSDMAGWWTSVLAHRCQCPRWDQWLRLKEFLAFGDTMDSEVERLNARKGEWGEAAKARGTIETTGGLHGGTGNTVGKYTGLQLSPDAVLPEAQRWQGWGSALKPAWEPICLARKPLDGTVAENVLAHGVGALNIDGCRIGDSGATDRVDYGRGRFPANLIHDGSAGVLAAFPREAGAGGRASGPTRTGRSEATCRSHMLGTDAIAPFHADSGSAARFFYTAKADADDRIGSKHPTVKPVDLMQWLVRLITPKGGLVLDPFAGTGTTGEAAWREGCSAVLIEREAEYQADIARRMAMAMSGPDERRRRLAALRVEIDAGPLFGSAAE